MKGVRNMIAKPDETLIWTVNFSGKADKQKAKLPGHIQDSLQALRKTLELEGPEAKKWPHYGKISGTKKNEDYRHCHLNKGKPVYVAIWKVIALEVRIMEVRYVGTHENADYRRIR
jgi:hypothetical protein